MASSDVREMDKNTKSSFVPIIGCFAGRLLLYPLAVVSLVTSSVPISGCFAGSDDLCREVADEKTKGRESTRTRKQKDEKAE